ncbi:adenylyl-sulfate kinase, partial [Bacillus pumilus]|uniref:adenylyl-sulfate kinase n=1 Tax=Bacillus pumilus TaxID=1408 RepID=UPI00119EB99C
KCHLNLSQHRDPNRLYKKPRNPQIPFFTPIHSPYQHPPPPHLLLHTPQLSPQHSKQPLLHYLKQKPK